MENKPNAVEELVVHGENYAKTSLELLKLKLMANAGAAISTSVAVAVSAIIFLLAILIASLGLSLYVGELLGKIYYGFFAVAGAYIILGIFFYFFLNNRVKKAVSKSLNEKLFS